MIFLRRLTIFSILMMAIGCVSSLSANQKDHHQLMIFVDTESPSLSHTDPIVSTFRDGIQVRGLDNLFFIVSDYILKAALTDEKAVDFLKKHRIYKALGTQFFLVLPEKKFEGIKNDFEAKQFKKMSVDSEDLKKELKTTQIRAQADHLEKIITYYKDFFVSEEKLKGPIFDIFIDGHGMKGQLIANLSPKVIQGFIRFCNKNNNSQKIKIGSLCISSCYVGGTNLDLIRFQDEISSDLYPTGALKDLTFPIIAWGVGDAPTVGVRLNIQSFFEHLAGIEVGKSSLEDVLRVLVESSRIFLEKGFSPTFYKQNIPQIFLPGGLDFQVLNIDEKIKIIGNVLVRIHAEENEPIVLWKKKSKKIPARLITKGDVDAVLIYPSVVSVPMWIRTQKKQFSAKGKVLYKFPQFISMKRGAANHFFKEVILTGEDSGILKFLKESFSYPKEEESSKIFLIEQLAGYNDLKHEAIQGKEARLEKIILNKNFLGFMYKGAQFKCDLRKPFKELKCISVNEEHRMKFISGLIDEVIDDEEIDQQAKEDLKDLKKFEELRGKLKKDQIDLDDIKTFEKLVGNMKKDVRFYKNVHFDDGVRASLEKIAYFMSENNINKQFFIEEFVGNNDLKFTNIKGNQIKLEKVMLEGSSAGVVISFECEKNIFECELERKKDFVCETILGEDQEKFKKIKDNIVNVGKSSDQSEEIIKTFEKLKNDIEDKLIDDSEEKRVWLYKKVDFTGFSGGVRAHLKKIFDFISEGLGEGTLFIGEFSGINDLWHKDIDAPKITIKNLVIRSEIKDDSDVIVHMAFEYNDSMFDCNYDSKTSFSCKSLEEMYLKKYFDFVQRAFEEQQKSTGEPEGEQKSIVNILTDKISKWLNLKNE